MPIEGFKIQGKGPASGLLWVDFSNYQIHGDRTTPAYQHALKQKAQFIDKVLATEFRIGTRHFAKDLTPLKSPADVLLNYMKEGGFYVEYQKDRQWKLDELKKTTGIAEVNNDAGNQG